MDSKTRHLSIYTVHGIPLVAWLLNAHALMHLMPHNLMLICLITASWRKVGLHRVSRDCIIVHQTNVPVNEAVQVIHGKLQSDKALILHGGQDYSLSWQGHRTAWGMPEVNLLQLRRGLLCAERGLGCSNGFCSLCFCGEPVLEVFRTTGTQVCPSKAPMLEARHRNVDYTCCIVKKGTMEELLRHLNSVRLSIKFILLKWRRMESSLFLRPCSRGEMMPAWMSLSTGSSHTHRPIPGLPVTSSIPCQERTGQVSVWQSKKHRHQAGQLAERRVPPYQSPEAERLPQCLYLLLISTFWLGCGDNQGTTTGRGTQTPTGIMLPYTEGVTEDIR